MTAAVVNPVGRKANWSWKRWQWSGWTRIGQRKFLTSFP